MARHTSFFWDTNVHPLRRAVGYIRVSSRKQGESGAGLDAQAEAIRKFARQHQIEVMEIYEDNLSGMGSQVLGRNQGLAAAINTAKTQGIPLLVDELSRIARNVDAISTIMRKHTVSIITVREGFLLDNAALHRAAARAQALGERISRTTREALRIKKAQGVKLGNRTNLREAQKKGAVSNQMRFDEKARELAKVLIEQDGSADMSAAEVVSLLNEKRILTGGGRPWTLPAVRKPLRAARVLIKHESEEYLKSVPNFARF